VRQRDVYSAVQFTAPVHAVTIAAMQEAIRYHANTLKS
jgi:hypothetical protein